MNLGLVMAQFLVLDVLTLRRLLPALLCAMAPPFAVAKPCAFDERSLVGAWQQVGSGAEFEQMEFSLEGQKRIFNSWLHQRPEISGGSWSLKDCVLKVSHPTEVALSFEFKLRGTGLNQLVLQEVGESRAGRYRRIKTQP